MHSCRKHRDNSATRDVGSAVGQGEVKDWRSTEIYKRQKIVTYYVCFYSSTMLTSKITTEIIENHSEFSGCLNSCNIFVWSRSWHTMKLPMIILWRGTSDAVAPLFKGRGGFARAMPPFSGIPKCNAMDKNARNRLTPQLSAIHRVLGKKATAPVYKVVIRPDLESNSKPIAPKHEP